MVFVRFVELCFLAVENNNLKRFVFQCSWLDYKNTVCFSSCDLSKYTLLVPVILFCFIFLDPIRFSMYIARCLQIEAALLLLLQSA